MKQFQFQSTVDFANMFTKLRVLLTALLFINIPTNVLNQQKINVTLMYESLCPDSIKFINEQLYPNWAELAPYVNINFIPFGKSSSINGGAQFKCQHGPMECMGNKLQSCALSGIDDLNAQVQFVHCFMNSFAKSDVGQQCAAQIGLNWASVEQCYNSQTGILLQLQAESVTRSVLPKFVPTIIYNEVFNQEDQNESIDNFKGVVCKHLNRIYPGICRA